MARSGRHLARRSAVQALYQRQITDQPPAEVFGSFIHDDKLLQQHRGYFEELVCGVMQHIDKIDARISTQLDRSPESVDYIELSILRLGCYELLFRPDVPTRVILDEAINLAKTFCAENGYRYVNGVLDKVACEIRGDG